MKNDGDRASRISGADAIKTIGSICTECIAILEHVRPPRR